MADEPEKEEEIVEEAEADAEETESAEKPKKSKRFQITEKKLLMFGVPALLLLGGAGYGATMMFELPVSAPATEQGPQAKLYYDLPEMVVNLSSPDKRVQYLKLKVALETSDQTTLDALTPVMPRVLDTFQLYLRELRSSDLEGSSGIFRLKEELLRRINLEIHPHEVNRVLFKEIIVQ